MAKKIYKLLKQNEDCVLLVRKDNSLYKIIDAENVTVYMGENREVAEQVFNDYDLVEVHRQQREQLDKWLNEFVEY